MTTNTDKLDRILEFLDGHYRAVPEHTRESFARYLACGMQPGGFLRAVLHNDLRMAITLADKNNYAALRQIVIMVHSVSMEECT